MRLTSKSAIFAAFALCAAETAAARPEQNKPNAREACRQAVAGAYLKVYDERERLKTLIRAIDGQIDALDVGLKALQDKLAKAEKEAQTKSFDVGLATRRDELAGSVKTYESKIAESRALRSSSADELDRHVATEKGLRQAIERVFVFTRTEDKPDGGYPTDLRFKAECPKFRHLCALPAKDVEQLLKIEADKAPIEPCQRYAGLSRLR